VNFECRGNGVTNIRLIKGWLEITPRETVEVKPGSFHVMFVGLKPLTAGEHVSAKLMFEKASAINVEYDVMAMGVLPGHDMPGMQMPGMQMPGR
jgi:periplasmic copper chaperone A